MKNIESTEEYIAKSLKDKDIIHLDRQKTNPLLIK